MRYFSAARESAVVNGVLPREAFFVVNMCISASAAYKSRVKVEIVARTLAKDYSQRWFAHFCYFSSAAIANDRK